MKMNEWCRGMETRLGRAAWIAAGVLLLAGVPLRSQCDSASPDELTSWGALPSSPFGQEPEIYIEGEIDSDTVTQFSEKLRFVRNESAAALPKIGLNSPGGDVYAAMEIGKAIRNYGNSAVFVQKGSVCFSACVLILAGGVQRFVFGQVGIHVPYQFNPSNNPKHAQQWFNKVRVDLEQYLRQMNVSSSLFEAMMSTPPERIRILRSQAELNSFGLTYQDPVFMEQVAANIMRKYKLSRQQYNERKARFGPQCAGDAGCFNRGLSTGR